MTEQLTTTILNAAAPRGGVITRQELLDLGISPSTIHRRCRSGMLRLVCHGVYQVDAMSTADTPAFRALAAIDGSVLSHHSAASMLGFPGRRSVPVEVTVPHGSFHAVEGIVVHQTRCLDDADIVPLDNGLRATSPARTLLDLAATVSQRRLHHLTQSQLAGGGVSALDLLGTYQRLARGRRGMRKMRSCLRELVTDEPLSTSELERMVWSVIRQRGLTGFSPQHKPPWFDGVRGTVDFAHPATRTILEADGRSWHRSDSAMTNDRRRDRTAAAYGWQVVRVTWADLIRRPEATVDDIEATLRARRRSTTAA